ncbi:hypothetical protein LTS08_008122 [Lithohypha guttulata]|uniref:uncharacterized protein n=1 Tax=Lithohypha guttulata TaxID=1690604 RepID=UPI002DDF7360|nr:hypothetical protein LTR51_005028 [Lithohypha guttulata]KAK5095480.1 hypothetical protein LTS08_008122 [Lithohypha guttulata]
MFSIIASASATILHLYSADICDTIGVAFFNVTTTACYCHGSGDTYFQFFSAELLFDDHVTEEGYPPQQDRPILYTSNDESPSCGQPFDAYTYKKIPVKTAATPLSSLDCWYGGSDSVETKIRGATIGRPLASAESSGQTTDATQLPRIEPDAAFFQEAGVHYYIDIHNMDKISARRQIGQDTERRLGFMLSNYDHVRYGTFDAMAL